MEHKNEPSPDKSLSKRGRRKFTIEQSADLLAMVTAKTATPTQLAAIYGCSVRTVERALLKARQAHGH